MKNSGTTYLASALAVFLAAGSAFGQPSIPMVQAGSAMPQSMMVEKSAMTGIPADIQKKMMDQQIKFLKDNSQLTTDIATGRLELHEMWLTDNPQTDKILAKMRDLDKLELQLKENMVSSRLAMYNLLPADMKTSFMRVQRWSMMMDPDGMSMMGCGLMCPMAVGMNLGMTGMSMMGANYSMMNQGMMGTGSGLTCPYLGGANQMQR